MPLTVEIVTAERIVRTEKGVDVLVAPGTEGQLAILPKHAALMTTLQPGELLFRRGTEEEPSAGAAALGEARNARGPLLAEAAGPAEEIDIARAEAARARAEERLRRAREQNVRDVDMARAAAALQRSLLRLRVADRRRRRTDGRPRV